MSIQSIKNRFGIIGNSPLLDRAIDVAMQVASTNLSVLITGESGVGKEVFSKIIHQLSNRKHGTFIAVNCGAIPEGTIDSELFGHEKGSFTGAHDARKGYFEMANGGTIFLDEVADLPFQTQVRLLRVLETGEYIRVGSSKVQKTDVRIVAATNVNMADAIAKGKFREDLYYRLNTVPIYIPELRQRKSDIDLLFRKFASDFAETYKMPAIRLTEDAKLLLESYRWPGNIRQLKNIAEQISILEKNREITPDILAKYIPNDASTSSLPIALNTGSNTSTSDLFPDKEVLYKFLFDMRKEVVDLKKLVLNLIQNGNNIPMDDADTQLMHRLYNNFEPLQDAIIPSTAIYHNNASFSAANNEEIHHIIEESLSLEEQEVELITKALEKHHGKRKSAAKELGISERTLYRKIKEYGIN